MKKKLELNGLSVQSLVTRAEGIKGGEVEGGDTINICPTNTVCNTEGTAGCSIGGGTTYLGIACA